MKKFVIVGAGTAGAISAAIIKKHWGNKVDVSVYYDKSKKIIGVGESTAPGILHFLRSLGLTTEEIIQELPMVTLKMGINFKNWIPDTSFFHGFAEVPKYLNCSSLHAILNDSYNGGVNSCNATSTVQDKPFDEWEELGLHIDTQEFSAFVFKKMEGEINLVDDVVTRVRVNTECNKIENIECKNSGIVEADYFIDASGFESTIFKYLNPEWHDIKKYLPLDKALSQEIDNKDNEIPSHTLAEATDNGWIWAIPVADKIRTGYLYSSKFLSDEEAKRKYNDWLIKNHNVNLKNDKIIKFRSGYYENSFIGNCMAVGLASGFVEPLEALASQMILNQLSAFTDFNSSLENLDSDRKKINDRNRHFIDANIKFVALHYATYRTDSDFWKYMNNNKMQWVKEFEELCKDEFIDIPAENKILKLWLTDSYIQIADGLRLFDKESIQNFIDSRPEEMRQEILCKSRRHYEEGLKLKKELNFISHKQLLDSIHK